MYVIIPKKYENQILFAGILREQVDVWSQQRIKRFLSSKKMLNFDRVYQSRNTSQTDQELCKQFKYKFILRKRSETLTFGNGPEILIQLMKSNRIYFEPIEFYYVPDCIVKKYFKVLDVLENAEISTTASQKLYWKDTNISFDDLSWLEDEFQVQISIYNRKMTKINGRYDSVYETIFEGNSIYEKKIMLHFQEETGLLIFIENIDKYFDSYFPCKNADKDCHYVFCRKKDLERHEKVCSTKESVRIIQKEYGPAKILIERAEKKKIIPKLTPNRNFLFFDIESCLPTNDQTSQKTKILNDHELVSIAVNRYCMIEFINSYNAIFEIVKDFLGNFRELPRFKIGLS